MNRTNIPYDGMVGGPDWDKDVPIVELRIDPQSIGKDISPLIYGYNAIADPARYGVASLRAGGNRFTGYNWENNASNAGRDYMHQSDGYLVQGSSMGDVPGEAIRPMLATAQMLGAAAIVTVPNVDFVAADKDGGGDVMNTPDYLTTRFRQNRPLKGSELSLMPDTTDAFVYQDELVNWTKTMFGDVNVLFSMDNEPDLWRATHPRIHPDAVTYAEVVRRNIEFATAAKTVWPAAPVLGFVSYGWNGYTTLEMAPDARGDFTNYYLDRMREAEGTAGRRLIDYLDLHWYPEATGIADNGKAARIVFENGAATDAGVVSARVQAPRSLWDPLYKEASWIGTIAGRIMLVPRMQQKIRDHYPGTKLAFTEWNYGGGNHVSGAVATADVLGIFGREGVGAANLWPTGGGEPFTLAAFAVYRNYDGNGARFGDRSVLAHSSSAYSASVYASVDTANPGRLVIVAINKRSAPTTARISIAGGDVYRSAAVWVLSGETSEIQPQDAIVADAVDPTTATGAGGKFSYEMPPLSVTVLVPGA